MKRSNRRAALTVRRLLTDLTNCGRLLGEWLMCNVLQIVVVNGQLEQSFGQIFYFNLKRSKGRLLY